MYVGRNKTDLQMNSFSMVQALRHPPCDFTCWEMDNGILNQLELSSDSDWRRKKNCIGRKIVSEEKFYRRKNFIGGKNVTEENSRSENRWKLLSIDEKVMGKVLIQGYEKGLGLWIDEIQRLRRKKMKEKDDGAKKSKKTEGMKKVRRKECFLTREKRIKERIFLLFKFK